MKSIHALPLALALALAPLSALAVDPPKHDEHHPEAQAATKKAPAAGEQMAKMDDKMKAMQEMHEKMMAATSPEERKALMAEQMKTMREGMSTMNGMKGAGAKPMSPQAMQKQMEMMKMMMQMMMDRMERMEGAVPAK